MRFTELVSAELPKTLQLEVDALLDIKMNSPEIKMIPRVNRINDYLDKSIDEVSELIATKQVALVKNWDALNELFLSTILG